MVQEFWRSVYIHLHHQSFNLHCLSHTLSFAALADSPNSSPVQPYMSLVVRNPAFCICENKAADQLRGNREADQRLCFRHTDSAIPHLSKSEISSLYPSSVAVHPDLCRTCSGTPKTGFLTTRLICCSTSSPSGSFYCSLQTCVVHAI